MIANINMDNDLVPEFKPGHVTWVNQHAIPLRNNFVAVKAILHGKMSVRNLNVAYYCFINIFKVMPIMLTPLQGKRILRARLYKYGQTLYTEQEQISYNRKYAHKIKLGRFNRKEEPLFYGSLPTESEHEDYVLSCALECCKELTDQYKPVPLQDLAVGGWVVQGPLWAINLCNDELHLQDNPSLREATQRFLAKTQEVFSPDIYQFIKEFTKYFAQMSRLRTARKEVYLVMSALFFAVRTYYKSYENRTVSGLIYSGAMSEGKGLNVVLTPQAVDQYLLLDKVVMYRHVLDRPGAKLYVGDKCSDIVNVTNKSFVIKNYIPPGDYYLNDNVPWV